MAAAGTVLSLIGDQSDRSPDAIAIECGTETRSYLQLQQLSDRIGTWLRKEAGVERGDLVGVLMGREADLVTALLGVWKAGAAYIPVDPAYPRDRIDSILLDSKVKYVLTGETVKNILNDGQDGAVLFPEFPAQDDAAYVLYTSGSTGTPKGVVINHRSLLNYVSWASASYFENVPAVLPLFTSVSFDLTLTSIFTPLISGGKVVVYREEEVDLLLRKILDNREITGVKLTPSHLRVVKELGVPGPVGVRKWIVGGENLETELARSIVSLFGPDTEIYNEYGPTEATVGCMIYRFSGLENTASVPIGRPIQNTQLYILDDYGYRVPIGVEGEIYIGGEGLALGYLHREALTEEKFIRFPLWQGTRLYRTGDLAVMNADGDMLFRGRKDDQVKLRGYRIELGEIGSRLSDHPEVGEAVVVLRDIGGEKALVAYYTGTAAEETLRATLHQQLPAYMLPSYYCNVERLPITANGKKDLRNLPAIQRGADNENKRPSNAIEERLVDIWSELLELEKERISVTKSFFELGGHSLKAISMVNRILMEWDVEVPLEEIFNKETIALIAQYIANEIWVKNTVLSPAMKQDEYILD
jgi:amino acid adenylation domain-containing protein